MSDAYDALEAMAAFAPQPSRTCKLATVTAGPTADKVNVRFDGDEGASGGAFVVASGVTVTTSDRVVMLPVRNSYIVIAKLP